MDDRWEDGSYWVGVGEVFVCLESIVNTTVFFHYLTEPGLTLTTSRPAFELFYRRLEPEEEGLILLSRMDK